MLHDRSDDAAMQLLVNKTRLASCSGPSLAAAHRRVGAALAPWVAQKLQLVEVPIEHVAGPSIGVALAESSTPIIVVLMRAGLFVAEGLWEVLDTASLVPWSGDAATLAELPVAGRPLILVDAVINSGKSIVGAMELLAPRTPASITVVTLVANGQGLQHVMQAWPDVDFIAARVSKRSYVGKGGTDTGARLFGTTQW